MNIITKEGNNIHVDSLRTCVSSYQANVSVGSYSDKRSLDCLNTVLIEFSSLEEMEYFVQSIKIAKEIIKSQIEKAAVPDNVPRARWKGAGMGDYECTNCWEITPGGDELDTCPHCKAYMR